MKPVALVTFFWPNNIPVLERYLEGRRRVVLTHPDYCTSDLTQRVEAQGSRLEALALGEQDLPELDQRLERLIQLLTSEPWADCCHALGATDPGTLANCVAEASGELLGLALRLLTAMEQARATYHIELLVVNEDLMLISRLACVWARRHGIPSLHLAHALPLGVPSSLHRYLHADHLAVFGERGTEGFLDSGVEAERLHVTGNPAWDDYPPLIARRAEVRRLVAEHLGLDPARPIVVYAPSWDAGLSAVLAERSAAGWLARFLESARELAGSGSPAQFVVKGHPASAGRDEALLEQVRAGVADCPPVLYTRVDAREIIVAVDLTISSHSNFAVECLLVGTPAINLLDESALRLGNCFDADCGVLEAAPEDLAIALRQALEEPGRAQWMRERMAAAAPRFNAGQDGQSARRVAVLMAKLARPDEDRATAGEQARLGYVWEQISRQEDADLKGAYHDHPRHELLRLLERPPRRVLDVGCATGATGELIKAAWPEAHVTGIELNRAAAERAKSRIDQVLGEKLEDIDFAAAGITLGSLDCVILADVLEHLYDPWDALLRIKPLLAEDAQVLVSLPNARNLWLINELASGRFSYTSEGLLDITHIRWFTRTEMEKMLRETGYRVLKSGRTPSAGLQDLTRPAGCTTVETDKIILKKVGDEEFEDLKSLQLLFLVTPQNKEELTDNNQKDFYELWRLGHSYLKRDALWISERIENFESKPLFHLVVVVPVGHERYLANTIRSFSHQFYSNWRLSIISSEPVLQSDVGVEQINWIQSEPEFYLDTANRLFVMKGGDIVGLMESGDKLAPHALFSFANYFNNNKLCQMAYSDEDVVDNKDEHLQPFFKTDFNLEMLRSAPFVLGGVLLLKRTLFLELGGYDCKLKGAELFDFNLRAWEKIGHAGIGHISDILFHRYFHGAKDVNNADYATVAYRNALRNHLQRVNLEADVLDGLIPGTFHIKYVLKGGGKVSIMIPTKNKVELLRRCITSIVEITNYDNYEILVIDNGSDDLDALDYLDQLRNLNSPDLRVLDVPGEFNFSLMNNRAAMQASGDYLLLLNNDVAVLHPDWLEEMLSLAQQGDVGAVGAKLFYPDGRIQHAGVILGMNNMPADHPFIGQDAECDGYYGRAKLTQEYIALTGACLLVRKSLYLQVGGLNEKFFKVSFNDVDFCAQLFNLGYRNIFTPYAQLLHEGSASQTSSIEKESDGFKSSRFLIEQDLFFDIWRDKVACEPFFNRNFSTHGRDFLIEIAPALSWDSSWRPRKRVLAHPADRFGCGEYRIISPMRALNDDGRIMGFETGNYLSIPELFRLEPDSIVFQRQVDPHQLYLMERYKRHSKAFRIYEIDDLITNIPIKSVRKKYFVEQKDLRKRFRKGLSLCDRFVVSTEFLAEQYKGYINDIMVVHNYIERERWGNLSTSRRQGLKPRVGWAGSITHDGDLAVIFDVVKALSREVEWIFFGMCPDEIKPFVAEYHAGVSLDEYPTKLASLNLDLAVAPLEDVPFNHGKSHLRLLEYGILGYPVICTDITPYRADFPVARVPNRFRDWVEAIRGHISDMDELGKRGDALREFIINNWILEEHLDVWQKAWLPS